MEKSSKDLNCTIKWVNIYNFFILFWDPYCFKVIEVYRYFPHLYICMSVYAMFMQNAYM